MSRPHEAASVLATSHYGKQPLRAGGAAIAASEPRTPAEACGGGGEVKMAFDLPIREDSSRFLHKGEERGRDDTHRITDTTSAGLGVFRFSLTSPICSA